MIFSREFVLVLFAVACVAGFLGALLGIGGGMFIVPALVLGFHLPVKMAVAASLVSVIATSNAGGSSYVDQHIANLRLGMFLEMATTIGALGGSVLALFLNEKSMLIIFAGLLFYMAGSAWTSRNSDDQRIARGDYARTQPDAIARRLNLSGSYHDKAAGRQVEYNVNGTLAGSAVSLMAGLASGLLGVGGGVLKVSAMNRFMDVPMKAAVGTSKMMIGVTAAVGSILFLLAGLIQVFVVAPVALGTTVGATAGTHVMNKLHSKNLKILLAALTMILGYSLLARAFQWPQIGI